MRFAELSAGLTLTGGEALVSEQEITEFARRYDPQWFHTDAERAGAGRWQGLIASGWMTCGIAMRLAVEAVLHDSDSIGSPGIEYIRWPHPVRPGDRLRLTIDVVESRRSRTGTTGVVRWIWWLKNQHDGVVLELLATSLFALGPAT
jgi:acyl dehydratase